MSPKDSTDGGASVQTTTDELVRAAAAQLYAGPPGDFIATRTALVKQAKASGDKDAAKEIGALRKPSVAAWLVNQVVHARRPVIRTLADLGGRLRHATSALDAAAITGMRGERDAVLADLVAAARQAADEHGQKLTAAVEAEVRDTGIAALADEAAQEVVGSGTMTRALAYSGFGEVDLSEAAATTSTGVVLTSIPGGRKPVEEKELVDDEKGPEDDDEEPAHEEPADDEAVPDEDTGDDDADAEPDDGAEALAEAAAVEELERRLDQAEEAVEAATKETGRRRASVEAARNRTDATRQRVQKLEAQLEAARAEDDQALEKLTQAVAEAKQADATLKTARSRLEELRG